MWRLLVLAASLAALPVSSALAQDTAAQFYKGRQVNVIVGSSAGGGYDIYARLVARHMGKHIPGNPTLVVSNMAGAGSNAAAAHVYNVAPKDGTVIGALQNTIILDCSTRYSARPSGSGTTPPSSSSSARRPSTITSASCAPTRR
jgi:tripartite-type tricarboxylate transporter receptor subunit TctC